MRRFLLLCTVLAGSTGAAAAADLSPADLDFFETKVRPLLDANCFTCHAKGKDRGGLSLATRENMLKGGDSGKPAVIPGDPEHSPLIVAVRYDDAIKMPKNHRLKDEEIVVLVDWVKRGAPWPVSSGAPAIRAAGDVIRPEDRQFWSFRPIADPPLPAVKDQQWCKQPLDHFILAKMEEKNLHPVASADKRVLIRRATFDLIGLPPTPQEIDAFLADDSPDAFAKAVDRLLASPHYGERWARHWLDVARYGEDQAHTFQARLYPFGYRYRDWVIQAFNDDMPYNRFVTEQIAGDLLKTGEPNERLPALGYFALGPHYYMDAGEVKAAEAAELDDRVDVLGRGFLGLTVACARCHDHKFDPITSQDYYALAGVFRSTKYVETPLAPTDVVQKYTQAQEQIKQQETKVKDFLDAQAKKLGENAKKVEAKLPDDAKNELAALRTDLDQLKKSAPPKPPFVHTLEDGPGEDMHIYLHGNPNNEGPVVERRFLRILSEGEPKRFTHGSGRLELAQAIVNPKNPLTARVIVNRIWQWHFGVGIVSTPSNFGKLGQPPTHPELLDHLATRFLAEGWSIKKLHREIMLSATYQLSSMNDDADRKIDPADTYYWRMNRRRLDVESWRDALLSAGGDLDPAIGGPSMDLNNPTNHRRTLYGAVSRHDLNNLLRLFDFPDPNITAEKRLVTTVPLQQLFVLNSDFIAEQARGLVKQLAGEKDDAAKIRMAFVRLYGRPATEHEVTMGLDFLAAPDTAGGPNEAKPKLSRWEQYAQLLLATNEFAFVD
ncbi:MAG TPA: PSD1 and planctomycete cytochrome C domain-containing protein [Gemmataceae bacterium]|nr:PSD1 and planctomycete cytochrome C domain-containing protein [Gemmataceae bacterium]